MKTRNQVANTEGSAGFAAPQCSAARSDIGWLQELERIAETADALEKWLFANTGNNDDWPIEIKTDLEGGQKLAQLLTDMKEALKVYRRVTPNDKLTHGATP